MTVAGNPAVDVESQKSRYLGVMQVVGCSRCHVEERNGTNQAFRGKAGRPSLLCVRPDPASLVAKDLSLAQIRTKYAYSTNDTKSTDV